MKIEDEQHLHRALTLAEQGLFSASPNPRVGCVIRRGDKTLGEGWHEQTGGAHAEIMAMEQCGGDLHGAEVYVSMEPCAHEGRTPPCAQALANARPARVIAAMPDPNPQVAGRGFAMLREAGIEVSIAPRDSEIFDRALSLNIGFVSRMVRARPWLRLKIAATLDGKTALSSGLSQWISGEESRTDAHRLRARSCAVLTGIGTALIDNPQLTVRHVKTPRPPLRILIDRDLSASPQMNIFSGGGTLVATASAAAVDSDIAKQLSAAGAEIISLPGEDGKVDLSALLHELARREMNEITVEAGRRLCGAFVNAGLADEIVVYQAPLAFGDGMGMLDMPPPSKPQEAPRFAVCSCEPLGGDVKIVYEMPQSRRELADAAAGAVI